MKIREARISDINKVAELVRGLSPYYLDDGQKECPEWLALSFADSAFFKRFTDATMFFNVVAEKDGVIVGYISIKSGFHLYHLFVASDYHKQGIARSLWSYCQEQLNIKNSSVSSSLFAVPFYTKLGFYVSDSISYKDGIGFQPMLYNRQDDSLYV